jgi:6,7-dimethyl-8-ribityllumazine synthase
VAALATALTLRSLRGTARPTGFSIRPADGSRA